MLQPIFHTEVYFRLLLLLTRPPGHVPIVHMSPTQSLENYQCQVQEATSAKPIAIETLRILELQPTPSPV